MKFSNKLSFAIFITGMIVLILLSFTVYKFSYNSIIKSQFKYTKSIADEVSGVIDQRLHEKVKTALTLANTPIIKKSLETSNLSYANLSGEKRKKSIRLLNEKWKSTKDPTDSFILKFTDNKMSRFLKNQQAILKGEYGEIFLTNKFGALVASTSKLSTFAHGHKYWWLGSYTNGEGAVFFDDRGYDDSVGGYVLGLVVPVRKGTEIIGILKCNLNILGSVSKLISGEEDKLIGKFKLTRSGGMVVFEEGFEPLSTQIHDSIFKKLKSKNQESFIINDSGGKYLVGFSEIKLTKGEKGYGFGGTFESIDHKKGNTGESWYVICYRQMSVVLAPITESIKSIILIGTAIILFLVVVSQLFGREIAKPLAILDKATEKIGKGNFEYRIDMIRNDEFGNLTHSFNSMANKLQQTTTSIELLRESEERHRTLIETLTDIVFIVDTNRRFTFINLEFEKITGFPAQDFIGHSFTEILAPEYTESTVDRFKRGLSGDTIPVYEVEFKHKGGKTVPVEIKMTSLLDADGEPIGRIGVARDISEQKKIQEELLKTKKLESLGTLAGGIAHDFNNLLSVIMGNISLARADIKLEDEPSKNLKEAEKASIKAKELTARLITFSRGGDPVKEVTPIGGLVKKSVNSVLSGSDVDCQFSISDDLLPVEIDEEQIKQVIRNITINAQEAMNGKGTIKTYCEVVTIGGKDALHLKNGRYIKISIKDQGPGIPEENLKKIFDPYFSTKEMGTDKGQGLGLSVCHSIVEKHDGLITVESKLGIGATFNVYLPATTAKPEELSPKHEYVDAQSIIDNQQSTIKRVLVMDDEEMIRDLSNQILIRLGYDTEVCKDGSEAIRMYEKARESEEPFDAVILDLTNELGMGGKEAMRRLLEIDPEVKGIVATGYSNDPVVTKFREYGFCGALAKPYTMDELSMTLYDVISGEPYRMEGQISDVHKSAYDNERTSEKKR